MLRCGDTGGDRTQSYGLKSNSGAGMVTGDRLHLQMGKLRPTQVRGLPACLGSQRERQPRGEGRPGGPPPLSRWSAELTWAFRGPGAASTPPGRHGSGAGSHCPADAVTHHSSWGPPSPCLLGPCHPRGRHSPRRPAPACTQGCSLWPAGDSAAGALSQLRPGSHGPRPGLPPGAQVFPPAAQRAPESPGAAGRGGCRAGPAHAPHGPTPACPTSCGRPGRVNAIGGSPVNAVRALRAEGLSPLCEATGQQRPSPAPPPRPGPPPPGLHRGGPGGR